MPSRVHHRGGERVAVVVGEHHVARARRRRRGARASAAVSPAAPPPSSPRSTSQRPPNTRATTAAAAASHCHRRLGCSCVAATPAGGEDQSGGGTARSGGGVGDDADSRRSHTPFGRRTAGVGEHRRGDLELGDLVARRRGARARYASIARALVVVDRVERVRRQQLGDLVGSQFTIHDPSIPRSTQLRAQPRQPGAYPALDGALGFIEDARDLAVGVPTEVRELDGAPLAVGQRRHHLAHLFGDVEVVRLEVEVVVGDHLGAAPTLLALLRRVSDRMRSTQRACASMRRNERSEPRAWSKRSGCSQSRRKISCTISSASARSQSSRWASAEHRAGVAPVRLGEGVAVVAGDGDDEPDVVGARVGRLDRHASVRHRRRRDGAIRRSRSSSADAADGEHSDRPREAPCPCSPTSSDPSCSSCSRSRSAVRQQPPAAARPFARLGQDEFERGCATRRPRARAADGTAASAGCPRSCSPSSCPWSRW